MKVIFDDDTSLLFTISLMLGFFGNVTIALIMRALDLPTIFDLGYLPLVGVASLCSFVLFILFSLKKTKKENGDFNHN